MRAPAVGEDRWGRLTPAVAVLRRELALLARLHHPRAERIALERWLRGREEYRKLSLAHWALVSWGKSGRTWLRVMLSRGYQLQFDLRDPELLDFDNLHRRHPGVPRVLFTHNNYLRDYLRDYVRDLTDDSQAPAHFERLPVVFLARDPRDVAVSQYFQWKYRMHRRKKRLNGYPPHGADVDVATFLRDSRVGVPAIVAYMNAWAAWLPTAPGALMIRYEDMRRAPEETLRRVFEHTGTPVDDARVREAVAFADYDNMKQLERTRFFRGAGSRVRPGSRKNPDSYKVRRAKVGGYRDYLDEAERAALDALIERELDPLFGYPAST